MVIFVAAMSWWAYSNLEWKELHLDLGWAPEASRSPYLAAKHFLAHYDSSVHLYQTMPKEDAVEKASAIFLASSDFLPLPSQQELLLRWVEQGGHLLIGMGEEEQTGLLGRLGFYRKYQPLAIYEADNSAADSITDNTGDTDSSASNSNNSQKNKDGKNLGNEEKKSLADQLRVKNQNILAKSDNAENTIICKANYEQCNELADPELDHSLLVQLYFEGDDSEITIYSQSGTAILHPKMNDTAESEERGLDNALGVDMEIYEKADLYYWAGDNNGIRFVQANFGQGMISIINDSAVFNNAHLGHFDHAYLLHILLAGHGHVLILEGKHMPALSTLLWRYYREGLVGALLLLLLTFWHLNVRFGAVRDVANNARRTREEGMRAIGQWHWRRSESHILLAPLRKQLFDAAAIRWPGFKRWNRQQQEHKIAAFCHMDRAIVVDVLECPVTKNEQQFLYLVKNLQKIRKAL